MTSTLYVNKDGSMTLCAVLTTHKVPCGTLCHVTLQQHRAAAVFQSKTGRQHMSQHQRTKPKQHTGQHEHMTLHQHVAYPQRAKGASAVKT